MSAPAARPGAPARGAVLLALPGNAGAAAALAAPLGAELGDVEVHRFPATGAGRVATCNTIRHPSNEIDVTDLVAAGVAGMREPAVLSEWSLP